MQHHGTPREAEVIYGGYSQAHVCVDCGQNWPCGHSVQWAEVALTV